MPCKLRTKKAFSHEMAFLRSITVKTTMRTIDRIEENMRLEQNCEKFRADHCVTKCEIRNKVEIFGDLAYTFPVRCFKSRASVSGLQEM